jgi:hypothetical protein
MNIPRAWDSSLSLMMRFPFESAAERPFGVMKPRAHRPKLATDDSGNVFVTHLLDEPEEQDLAVLYHQFVEGGVDLLHFLGGKLIVGTFVCWHVDTIERTQWFTPFPQLAINSMPGDPVEPGDKRARLDQLAQVTEDAEPDFLKDILGRMTIAEHFFQEVVQPRLVDGDKLLEGCSVTGLGADDQNARIEPLCAVAHGVPDQKGAFATLESKVRRAAETFN